MAFTDLNLTYGILMSLWNVLKVFFYQNSKTRFDHVMGRFSSRGVWSNQLIEIGLNEREIIPV